MSKTEKSYFTETYNIKLGILQDLKNLKKEQEKSNNISSLDTHKRIKALKLEIKLGSYEVWGIAA